MSTDEGSDSETPGGGGEQRAPRRQRSSRQSKQPHRSSSSSGGGSRKEKSRAKKFSGIEEHFLLRLPEHLADRVHTMIQQDEQLNDIGIQFTSERRGVFRLPDLMDTTSTTPLQANVGNGTGGAGSGGGLARESLDFQLVDLACNVETYKSFDHNQYFKIGDISQMFFVKDRDESDIPFEFPSGITPATENILHHWRNRQIHVSKQEIKNMEKFFIRLIEEENPENLRIEIISEDEEDEDPNTARSTTEQ